MKIFELVTRTQFLWKVFFKLINLKKNIFLMFVLVRCLYWCDVCTGAMFVLVRCLYWCDVCTGAMFVSLRFVKSDIWGSDICTVPTFVLYQRLYCTDVCTVPTFVLYRRSYSPTCVGQTFILVPLNLLI